MLERVLWVWPEKIEVVVRDDGEVELAGELETETDVEILEKLVARIPGVVSLRSSVMHRPEGRDRAQRFAGDR